MVLKITSTSKSLGQAAIIAACLLILPVSNVHAQSNDELKQRLRRMESELQTLNRAVYKGEELPASGMVGGGSGGDPSYQANLEIRLNALESQLRDMTGKVEQQDFAIQQMRDQLTKTLTDIDLRMGDLENKQGAGNAAGMPAQAVPPQANGVFNTTDSAASAMEPASAAAQEPPMPEAVPGGMPRALSTPTAINPAGDTNSPAPSNSPTQQNLGVVPETAVQAPAATGNAADDYEAAFSQLKSGNYSMAQAGFDRFIAAHPNHQLMPNAIYWRAETFYAQKQYDQSARAFAESFQKYPKGPKAADSLLKLGLSLGETGKTQDACVTLKQVKKQFPTGEGAMLRRTDQEIKRLGCA